MLATDRDQVFEIVKQNICRVLPDIDGHDIDSTDRLVDLGANSVDRAEIAILAMEELSLQIPRIELAGIKNIGGLVDVLYNNCRRQ